MQIIQKSSPNYSDRRGRKIIAIVNHITAGLMPGTLSWLQNPAAKASAHYLVTKAGQIYQLVADDKAAWHAGIVAKANWPLYDGSNPNYYTLGIEHESLAGEALTEAQYQATLWLHRQLVAKHNIPIDTDHIIGHYRLDSINRKNDPGPAFPWSRLLDNLKGDEDLTPVKIIVDGKPLTGGHIVDSTSYAPVRALAEALGAKVGWDPKTSTVIIEGRK